MRIGYKVVREYEGRLLSCVVSQFFTDALIGESREYGVGKITTPSPLCGPLAVFTTTQAAFEFATDEYIVYQCVYEPSAERCLYIRDGLRLQCSYEGTDYADVVVLIREVEDAT